MHANAQLIERLYQAFQRQDGAAMAACYSKDAHFSDPGFPDLRGADIGAMWTMLTSRAKNFSLEYSNVQADADGGSADWVAHYTFNSTGRSVVNRIRAEFRFRDGLITQHSDHFNFYAWVRQALGPIGWALGWTGMLKRKVQATAAGQLQAFIAKRG
jgi:ketosteroid isomerase-like protein